LNPPASEESLIARILDSPPEERAECLRRAYVENPELRERLQQIASAVASFESTGGQAPLPSSDAERARVFELAFARQESAGASIGPYKLIQELGEGGFGVVWLAEQQEPIRRRVALKVIKVGMDTREVIARFETERQALALMDHPGIARVFDAGTTEAGRPFFVMELVRGTPITRYCDDNRLTVGARLRLFIPVCRAVQHAHQKGVIHRDLKPSNIIVTVHDGVASPKIIDFGIAKATETPLTERTLFTRFHAFIGTPAYSSPEQMEMSGLDVDTRSDIYSLGVLLYELLAGRPPFDPGELLKSSLEAMRRTIREVEPPVPSQSVRSLAGTEIDAVAGRRATTHTSLVESIRGDLDWIVMRCLEKEPARRYETAGELAADVGRFLADMPVQARPAGATYKLRKFVRRNRLAVAAVAAVVLSLVAGLVVASVALVREHAARERESAMRLEADANAAQARTEAAKSEQAARFMQEMLSGAGPSAALGRDATILLEILDTTASRLDTELAGQPEVATDVRETLALVNRDLGRFAEAEALLARVVESRRATGGEDSAQLATSLNHHGVVLARLGRDDEADVKLKAALEIRRKLFGTESPETAETMFELAQVFVTDRGLEASRQMLEKVLAIRRKVFGAEHVSIADTLTSLGTFARMLQGHEEAVVIHSQAVEMYRRTRGPDHPDLARSLDNLGYSIRHIRWTDEAMAPYREAYFIRRKILGAEHPDLVVSFLRHIGQIPVADSDDGTVEHVREFVAEQRRKLPARSSLLAPALFVHAEFLDRPDRDPALAGELRAEAAGLIDEAIAKGALPDEEVADAMLLYGWWKFLDGDCAEAIQICDAGLRLFNVIHAKQLGALIQGNHILAWVYHGSRDFEGAARHFAEAVRLIGVIRSNAHPFLGADLAGFSTSCRKLGRTSEAHDLLKAALDRWKWGRDPGVRFPRSFSMVLGEYGIILNDLGRYAEAEPVLRESLQLYDASPIVSVGLRLMPRGVIEIGLGTALAKQERFEEAEPIFVHAFEDLKTREPSFAGEPGAFLREALESVIAFYEARGMPEKVAEWQAKRR